MVLFILPQRLFQCFYLGSGCVFCRIAGDGPFKENTSLLEILNTFGGIQQDVGDS